MALAVSGQRCELREVVLRDKPAALLAVSLLLYGLIAALIAVAAIAAMQGLGGSLNKTFNNVSTKLNGSTT